jgi:hypothetical protein
VEYPNVDPLIGTLVSNKMATLHELKTVYTLDDAYDLFEILSVSRYNEFLAIEDAKQQKGQR